MVERTFWKPGIRVWCIWVLAKKWERGAKTLGKPVTMLAGWGLAQISLVY